MGTVNHVILLVIDDLRADQFRSLINEGRLPNMKEYLTNEIMSDSISCFPGITIPAQPTMLTGAYPDAYYLPGGHWVRREEQIIRNYNSLSQYLEINKELGDNVKTLFELVPGNTGSLLLGVTRGASHVFPKGKLEILRLYLWHVILLRRSLIQMNTLMMDKLLDYFNKPRKFFNTPDPPRLSITWALATDAMLHTYGPESEMYLRSLYDLDLKIGELINGKGKRKGLKELGYYDDTAILVTSDHGNYTAKEWVDIASYFTEIGLTPLRPKKQEGNFDATIGSIGFFNLRGETWIDHPTIEQMKKYGLKQVDLFQALFKIPGIKYMYYRADGNTHEEGTIHVLKKENETIHPATIEYQKDKTRLVAEKDIFGYEKDKTAVKMLDDKFHTIDEWLKHTHHIDFPMIVDQVARIFRNPNFCDIVISSCGETIFNYEHGVTKKGFHIHGHDIGLRQALAVPLLVAGPEVPAKKVPYAKSTDIAPTILKLLGEPIPSQMVGNSLI